MRSYSEAIARMGNQLFSRYMSGSNDLLIPGTGIISYIYGVPEEQVVRQIEQQYQNIKNDYYNRINKK
jgi:hypothetical protein